MKPEPEKLKILVGMPEKTARGGINACEPPFLRALEDRGVTVREAIYSFENNEKTSLSKRVRQVAQTARKFAGILITEDFDLLHINTAFDWRALLRDAFTVFRIGKRKTKIFLKFHGSDADLLARAAPPFRFLIRYLIRNADAIGVLSSEEKRNFVRFGLPEEKFQVVKNALSGSPGDSFPQVENFSVKSFRLLFVSRLIPTKGVLETVEAAAILRAQGFDIVLDVLGDGEARPAAEALTERLKLGEIVRFHGHVPETRVQEFYHSSDLLVFPTFHQEGFPMVIFNALRFGLPVVTTKIRAAADYLTEYENCLFCEARSAGSVAERIAELIENPSLRQKMATENQILAQRFTPERVAAEYLEIYRKLIAS